jgi:citrate synthase
MLTAAEAARRLGVKPETLYAYVSRGQLTRHREGRRSLFARAEVERLAARGRRGPRGGELGIVGETALTRLDPEGALFYRGADATRLARESTYEAVAELLWEGEPATPWQGPRIAGEGARPADHLRVIVARAAAADPLRADLRPPAVRATARRLIATMVDSLPPVGTAAEPPAGESAAAPGCVTAAPGASERGSIAARLWSRLHPAAPTPARLRLLDAALILLADHELALSALAARVAASAHADPYLVVLAGLSAQGGALHGGAGTSVERLLAAIPDADAAPGVLGERLAAGEALPGFGHAVYTGRDPRADVLLELLREAEPDPGRLAVAWAVLDAVGRHDGPAPNVDFALGAVTDCLGLEPGAAEATFAIARTAGLVAHALEEYPHRLRFRARAVYAGP